MVGGAVPTLKGEDFMALLPRSGVDLAFEEFANLPSSHLTPVQALDLGRRVEAALSAPDVDGVVVTHGTDTLEETAYLLDLTINSPKPVVVTGAMRTATMLGYDGVTNLAAAIRVAATPEARGLGVLVVFNERIFAASEVQKVHSQQVDAFDAPGSGPLGRIEGERVSVRHRPQQRLYIPCSRLEELVDLIKICQGASERQLRHSIDDGVAGIVIESFGSGRVPPGAHSTGRSCRPGCAAIASRARTWSCGGSSLSAQKTRAVRASPTCWSAMLFCQERRSR